MRAFEVTGGADGRETATPSMGCILLVVVHSWACCCAESVSREQLFKHCRRYCDAHGC
jgi:hypothetical protein